MQLINRIIPFFIALIIFAFLMFGFVLLAYLILFSAILGSIIYIVNRVRAHFITPDVKKREEPKGRIIDTDDWHKL